MDLVNNSNEMKTTVETYLIEETVELLYDNEQLDKYNQLVQELGIENNAKIQSKDKSPIPFMHMKISLINIFETLCPAKVNFKNYSLTPIPVEILELISLSIREKYFSQIEIWYDDKSPDPVCVGISKYWYIDNGKGTRLPNIPPFVDRTECEQYIADNNLENCRAYAYTWEGQRYIIGKWGDVKRSFAELKQMAKDRFIEVEGANLRKTIKDSQRALDDLEITAVEKFN